MRKGWFYVSRLFSLIFVHADLTRFFSVSGLFLAVGNRPEEEQQGFTPDIPFRGRSSVALTLYAGSCGDGKEIVSLCRNAIRYF